MSHFERQNVITTPDHEANVNAKLFRNIERASEVSLGLAEKVEAVSPGTTFGLYRHNHMQESRCEVSVWALELQLTPREERILEFILCTHDIGRFKEALEKHAGRPTVNHGIYSVELMMEHGLLEGLEAPEKQLIIDAVRWHGEGRVDLPPGRSRQFCYILRDIDKMSAFLQTESYTPEFVVSELLSHFELSADVQQAIRERRDHYERFVEQYFRPGGGARVLTDEERATLPGADVLHRILNTRLTEDTEGVQAIFEGRRINFARFERTYPNWFLFHCGFIFDVAHGYTFRRIEQERLLDYRLNFISERCDEALMAKISDKIDRFVASKLSRA